MHIFSLFEGTIPTEHVVSKHVRKCMMRQLNYTLASNKCWNSCCIMAVGLSSSVFSFIYGIILENDVSTVTDQTTEGQQWVFLAFFCRLLYFTVSAIFEHALKIHFVTIFILKAIESLQYCAGTVHSEFWNSIWLMCSDIKRCLLFYVRKKENDTS